MKWRRRCRTLRLLGCNDLALPRGGAILDEFLSPFAHPEGSVRQTWKIFKADPFDPRLRTHKIQSLSAHYGRTIYAVEIEGDLRSTFYLDGDMVVSLVVGTHDIYKC